MLNPYKLPAVVTQAMCGHCREQIKQLRKAWWDQHPTEKRKEAKRNQKFHDRRRARSNSESLPKATRHKTEWTGPDLELAARTDLTAAQVAEMTGRSISAVRNARHRLKEDPRYQRLAGTGTDGPHED